MSQSLRYCEMVGADNTLDTTGNFDDPMNPLPARCPECRFPDIDFVPQPYFIHKSRSKSATEIQRAELGNFLVRPRTKKIIQFACPGQCQFYQVKVSGSDEQFSWELAVPIHLRLGGSVKPSIRRCPKCGEPLSAHYGSQWERYGDSPTHDITKDSQWHSKGSDNGWKLVRPPAATVWRKVDYSIDRVLVFSTRLAHLLREYEVEGLCPILNEYPQLDERDLAWIEERRSLLQENAVSQSAEGRISKADQKWFRSFLKSNKTANSADVTGGSSDAVAGFKTPKSYIELIQTTSVRSFQDIDGLEGFEVRLLAPRDFFLCERRGNVVDKSRDAPFGRQIVFATTGHGDCFCFSEAVAPHECPIYHYKHEYDEFELYAANFAQCLHRWAASD